MTSHRRDISLGISPITILWYAPLALLLCLGLSFSAELRAQDTTQAPVADTVAAEAQDTLESADSTVVVDPAVVAAAALTQRAEELAAEISILWFGIDTLFQRFAQAEGEERLVLDGLLDRRVAVLRPLLGELTAKVVEMDSAGLDASAPRAVATEMLDRARRLVIDELRAIGDRLFQLRAERSTVPLSGLVTNERRLTQEGADFDVHLTSLINIA